MNGVRFTGPHFICYSKNQGARPMDITSPYVVVAAIVLTFAVSILYSTSSKEDGHNGHDAH